MKFRWLNFNLQNSCAKWARAHSNTSGMIHDVLTVTKKGPREQPVVWPLSGAGWENAVRAPSGCPPWHAVVWSHLHHMAHIHKALRELHRTASLCKWGHCTQGQNLSLFYHARKTEQTKTRHNDAVNNGGLLKMETWLMHVCLFLSRLSWEWEL